MKHVLARYLTVVVSSAIGAAVGWFLASFVTTYAPARLASALFGLFIANHPVVTVILPGVFRKPEGGYLPRRIKPPARDLDRVLVASRIVLRKLPKGNEGNAVQTARRLARSAALDATLAGYSEVAREIVRFREACAGPPYIQAAWVQVIAAAREGIAEGESSGAPAPR